MPETPESISLLIIVHRPVPGVWGALQEGHGSAGRPFALQKSPPERAVWEAQVTLRQGRPAGPFIQKDSKGSFIYLLWGASSGQPGTAIQRRAKVYLPGGPDFPGSHKIWVIEFEGRGKDGGPACATIKPTSPWRPQEEWPRRRHPKPNGTDGALGPEAARTSSCDPV
ncbi:MAG: hypothetical protein HZC36_11910 [Armatimonadetes bacterium]|nr:hypothetical protein [Armatimonadota bacterium]